MRGAALAVLDRGFNSIGDYGAGAGGHSDSVRRPEGVMGLLNLGTAATRQDYGARTLTGRRAEAPLTVSARQVQ